MITKLKKIIPISALNCYHKSLAVLANWYYGRPSEQMVIIGVTGTNGKTSTCDYIARILEAGGQKVGLASTAMFKIAEQEWLNDQKMTMLGRFALQKMLRRMVSAGCRYAVVETSSQGIEQFRHLGVHYDLVIFTNLTPEHIESHGGFENYKKAKLKLFKHLETSTPKKINGNVVKKTIVVNGDDQYAAEFLNFKVDRKIVFGLTEGEQEVLNQEYIGAEKIEYLPTGTEFYIGGIKFKTQLFGKFNVYNCLAAIAVAQSQGVDLEACSSALGAVRLVPGRMEFIESDRDFKVLVDYAPEPESMRQLFETIQSHHLVTGKIIHVFGSCGGGRDVARRPILGELSATNADVLVVTNEDPYDDDPQVIIDMVAEGAISKGKILNQNLFKIIDRREAIKFAFSQAQAGDLVLLTGKGCEQAICVANGRKLQWDEREVARQLLVL